MNDTASLEELEAALADIPAPPALVTPPVTVAVTPPVTVAVVPAVASAPVDTSAPQNWTTAKPASASNALGLTEFVDPDKLAADVRFDPNNLDNAIREHAALYVFYAAQAAKARRQYESMKATADVMVSKLYSIHRETAAAEGKKTTEAAIDASVKMDSRWYQVQQKLIDARAIYDLADDAREAFKQRRDMLIQVSVDRRTERKGDMTVMEQPTAASSNTEARQRVLAALAGSGA